MRLARPADRRIRRRERELRVGGVAPSPTLGATPELRPQSQPRASCPRISPFGFFAVWTFTYRRCFLNADISGAVIVAVPVVPLLHGAQSGTTTFPDLPLAAMWMCAAEAGPVNFAKVSFHFSVVPL